MPPGGVGAIYAQFDRLAFQLFRYAGHPDERVDEECRYAKKIGNPVALGPASDDVVQFILQSVKRHVEKEEKPRSAEINEPEPEAGPVRVLKSHTGHTAILF